MPSVAFYPRAVAHRLVPEDQGVIISIHDAGQLPADLHPDWKDVLRLSFHDIDVAEDGFELFDASMAQEVMDFATRHADKPCITVHCNMGVSRSAAIALFLSEWQNRDLYQQGRRCLAIPDSYNRTVHRVLTNTWLGDAPSAFEMQPG